jgi:hypothetical protein
MKLPVVLLLACVWGATTACAQPNASVPEVLCHDGPQHRVIERVAADGPGADLLIRPKPGGACEFKPQAGDWPLPRSDAERFKAFAGALILIDNGTGPSGRQLFIADPAQRQLVRRLAYTQLVSADAQTIVVWRATQRPATPDNCPQLQAWKAQLLSGSIEEQVQLTLPALRETVLPTQRCTARQ